MLLSHTEVDKVFAQSDAVGEEEGVVQHQLGPPGVDAAGDVVGERPVLTEAWVLSIPFQKRVDDGWRVDGVAGRHDHLDATGVHAETEVRA